MTRIAKHNGLSIAGFLMPLLLLFGWCHTGHAVLNPRILPPSTVLTASVDQTGGESGSKERHPAVADPRRPEKPGREQWNSTWIGASPSLLGFDPVSLEVAANEIGRMKGIYGLLLVRNGYLVVEQYYREGYRTKPHNMKSASKSVLSALIGIAIDEGLLSLDIPVSKILPNTVSMTDPRKADITVRHLLTMTSGLTPTSYQAYNSWVLKGDWVKAALDRPLVADPGTHFQYSTGNTHVLSAILTAVTGMSTKDYALQKLFDPMKITLYGWDTDPRGIYQGGNNLQLLPRDMARIGQLYLDGGRFDDRQIVPKRWVEESTKGGRFGENEVYGSYGYLWFSAPSGRDAFVAVGFGGQYIYIAPTDNCVVVVTSTLESKGRPWEMELFERIHTGIFGSIMRDHQPLSRDVWLGSFRDTGEDTRDSAGAGKYHVISHTTNNVILRNGPSRQSKRLGLVASGNRVHVLETRGQWLRVRFGGKKGWVFSPYVNTVVSEDRDLSDQSTRLIAFEGKPGGSSVDIQPTVFDETTTWAVGSRAGRAAVRLNLRTGPSQTDSVIRILNADTLLEVKEKIGSWLRVRAGGQDGWVFAEYVRILPTQTMARMEPPEPPAEDTAATSPPPVGSTAPEPASTDLRVSRLAGDLKTIEAIVTRLQAESVSSGSVQTDLSRDIDSIRRSLLAQQKAADRSEEDRMTLMEQLTSARTDIETLKGALRSAAAGGDGGEGGQENLQRQLETHADL